MRSGNHPLETWIGDETGEARDVNETKNLIAYFSRKGNNYVDGSVKNLPVGNTELHNCIRTSVRRAINKKVAS